MTWRKAYAVSVVVITIISFFGGVLDASKVTPNEPGMVIGGNILIAPVVGVVAGLFWGTVLWGVVNLFRKLFGAGADQ